MNELLLVNPRARRKTSTKTARRNPRRKATTAVTAPRRRRVSSRKSRVSTATRRTYARARSGMGKAGIVNMVKDGGVGALGALAVDLALAKLPLPAMLTSGNMKLITKTGLAIAVGVIAGKMGKRDLGHKMAIGAITISAYEALRGMVGGSLGLNAITDINGMGFYSSAQVDGYDDPSMFAGADSMGMYDLGGSVDNSWNTNEYSNDTVY